ncbi:MAG: 2-phospho-L-lactate transferase [Gammaproteobacteria bacterium]|nr:2-phospho-L-lactate transferase [Gammaproteobacteria bacterium]MYF38917.1 2-phospho-L-lactate transferase [Gammaproteobacteria bacterium]
MRVLAITGGVGGAKLAVGLAKVLQSNEVVFLVNTGDDFRHLGLHISPDLDTLTYSLANISCPAKGWGRRDESWTFVKTLQDLGGPSWFQLGDQDLALHAYRTQLLTEGRSLTEATQVIAEALDVKHSILPASDDPVATTVESDIGELSFQHYFVKHQCRPKVQGIRYVGADRARLNLRLDLATISLVVICPSNPYLSVDPILAIPDLRKFLRKPNVAVLAVSPIVRGRALKGPTTKIMTELGYNVDNETIALHYADFLTGFIVDGADATDCDPIQELGIKCIARNTVMHTTEARVQLARDTLDFGATLSK